MIRPKQNFIRILSFSGLTVVELIVSLVIGIVVIIGSYMLYNNFQDASNEKAASASAKQMSDAIIGMLSRDFIEEHQSKAEGLDKPKIMPHGLAFKVPKRANSIFQTQCIDLPENKTAYGNELKKILPDCACFKNSTTKRPIIKVSRGPEGKAQSHFFPDEILSSSISHTKPFAACLWISNLEDSVEIHVGFAIFSSQSRESGFNKFKLIEARKVFNLQAVNRFIRYR